MKPWAEQFYNSTAWKDCRKAFLQSREYICERHNAQGETIYAPIAHHKIYLTQENIIDPLITLSWDNLEALCQTCHNTEHHRAEREHRYKFDSGGNIIPLPPISKKI